MILFLLLVNVAQLQAQAPPPVHGTYTINLASPTNVEDDPAGINFQTFTEAIMWLSNGVDGPVVFNVVAGSGPYEEQINISNIDGTSPLNTITFNGNGATIQNESHNSLARAVIKLDNVSYVTLDNLKVIPVTLAADSSSFGWGIALLNNADNNVIKNCTITIGAANNSNPQNTFGILITSADDYPNNNGISNCDHNIIDNNTVIGGYDGIILDNYAGNVDISFTSMDDNQVTNNKISNFLRSGIRVMWNKRTLVEGNDISGVMVQGSYGIDIDVKSVGLKVNANRIHHISADPILDADLASATIWFKAIEATDCIGDIDNVNTISNNLIYDITTTKSQQGIGVTSCSFINVYNNTILLNGLAPLEIPDYDAVTVGLLSNYGNQNARFENNIVSVTRPGSKANAVSVNDTEIAITFDYNDIIGNGTNFGSFSYTDYADLAAWQLASALDAHSTSQDPVFTNIATGNYKPTSPAFDNLGTFVGIKADINAEIRNNNNPDIGAYEFLTPACVSLTLAAGNAVSAPAVNVCSGSIRTLNLSGNSFGTGQTYKWQSSATGEAGTYTDISSGLVVPSFDVFPPNSTYYQAVVGCGGNFVTSAAVLIAANHPLTGSYTINSAAATAANNFQSFTDLLLALKCGISGPLVLDVAPGSGPYNEQVIFNAIDGASATNTITLNGNGNTLSYLSTNYDERATLKLRGTDYMTVNNLTVTAEGSTSSEYGIGIQLMSGANHNVISNNIVNVTIESTSPNFSGIVVNSSNTDLIGDGASYCDDNKITGNTVTGGSYGISLYSNGNVAKIYNDTITNNIIKDMYAYGIYVLGTSHALIEGNDISRPTRTRYGSSAINGIGFANVNSSLLISKNRIHNNLGGVLTSTVETIGIISNRSDAPADSVNTVSNNVLYNFNGLGTQTGLYNNSSDNVVYYNNTISLDDAAGASTRTARAIYHTDGASGLVFRNNNISIKRSGTGTNHGIYIDDAGTTFTASNNNYFINGASSNNNIGYREGSGSYTTVAAWQAFTTTDANSVAVNPNFVDTANGNFSPQNLLLDNKGTPVAGITTDIIGTLRSTSLPDIGAYEFAGVLPVKLLDVTAIKAANDVVVNWTTVTELNTKSFIIERSATGTNFTEAGSTPAIGNSNIYQQYKFIDKDAAFTATNKVLYYRLKMVDIDGYFEYSKIVKVQFDKTAQPIINVFPNPFVAQLAVRISTPNAGKALVQLSDNTGRIISKQEKYIAIGTTFINIDKASQLTKGVYLVSVEINGSKYATKVIK